MFYLERINALPTIDFFSSTAREYIRTCYKEKRRRYSDLRTAEIYGLRNAIGM